MRFQFKIKIKDISKPPVWRKVSIPANVSFLWFHNVIQTVFGWEDAHLFEFKDKEYQSRIRIGIPYEDDFFDSEFAAETKDASKIKLSAVFKEAGQKMLYIYDFGDCWVHEITLESLTNEKQKGVFCLSGKGACPPEDCGGIYGYEAIKNIFKISPDSEDAAEYRDWLGLEDGENWDPEAFDIDEINSCLKQI